MGAPNMDGYIEVNQRIDAFYEKYPEGSLRCKEWKLEKVGDQTFFVYVAQAYRTADDQAPAEGIAWEPVPGKTNFTRDSEAMNAETSGWGRAIAALGFEVKRGIASANEVRSRQAPDDNDPITKGQARKLFGAGGLFDKAGMTAEAIDARIFDAFGLSARPELNIGQANQLIGELETEIAVPA